MTSVINETRDRLLGRQIKIARGFVQRLRGLIGRRGWDDFDGLWIEPCTGVHALGMRIAVDVVLVDEDLRALWVQTLRPWRLGRVHLEARAALELPEGVLARTGTRRGDQLALRIEKGVGASELTGAGSR